MIAVLLGLSGFFGFRYYNDVYRQKKTIDNAYNDQQMIIDRIKSETQTYINMIKTQLSASEGEKFKNRQVFENNNDLLKDCKDVNKDIMAWLEIPDTNISYPIMQSDDNDFYLHNGVDGNYNYEFGCPFLDYRCQSDFRGFNSIIYAHNMDQNRMFSDIPLYKDADFFKDHNTGYLILSNEVKQVDFFAYLTVPSNSFLYNTVLLTEQEKNNYIDLLFGNALYINNYSKDEIKGLESYSLLLLSTCTFEYEDARGILAGLYY